MKTIEIPKVAVKVHGDYIANPLEELELRGPCLPTDSSGFVSRVINLGANFVDPLDERGYAKSVGVVARMSGYIVYWLKTGFLMTDEINGDRQPPSYMVSAFSMENRNPWDRLFVSHTKPKWGNDGIMWKSIIFSCRHWDEEVETAFRESAIRYMQDFTGRACGLLRASPDLLKAVDKLELIVQTCEETCGDGSPIKIDKRIYEVLSQRTFA